MIQNTETNSRIKLEIKEDGFSVCVPARGFLDLAVLVLFIPGIAILIVAAYFDYIIVSLHGHIAWGHIAIMNLVLLSPAFAAFAIATHYGSRRAVFVADTSTLSLVCRSMLFSSKRSWMRKDIGDVDLQRWRFHTYGKDQLRMRIRLLDPEGCRIALILGFMPYADQVYLTKCLRRGLRLGEFHE